jgi:hypothetical protein
MVLSPAEVLPGRRSESQTDHEYRAGEGRRRMTTDGDEEFAASMTSHAVSPSRRRGEYERLGGR